MLEEYRQHVIERAQLGIVPKPINAIQIKKIIELLQKEKFVDKEYLLNLLIYRVPPGVDEAALYKVKFLKDIAIGKTLCSVISKKQSVKFLGTMKGGYNVPILIDLLDDPKLAPTAAQSLKTTLLIYNNFIKIKKKAQFGNKYAKKVLHSWANKEWFFHYPKLKEKITVTIFKVPGETNTDDLSPATDAWSRPDIPLHALSMLKYSREGIIPDDPGSIGPIKQIKKLKTKGFPIAYTGDIIGTGSSRKSAVNSILWYIGNDIPYVPNKRTGGLILAKEIAPIFLNTIKDSGGFPIETNVFSLNTGDIVDIYPYLGKINYHNTKKTITTFTINSNNLINEIRVGGRITFIIGEKLTKNAKSFLQTKKIIKSSNCTLNNNQKKLNNSKFTLAQKIIGRACNMSGVHPGEYCEPQITSIGSQDTTGPMTRDELKDLACLNFSNNSLVIQSFCHTAAYPKKIDIELHQTLPNFIINRGGISLKPGDGIIHSWLNRMLLPDTVGTGGDSHTRFPIGISFPAGSGLIALAATLGIMPLYVPESVLIKFKGNIQPGITTRDLVHSIPYYAIQNNLLTLNKKSKQNIFSGRILEIEGLSNLTVEQAFEFSDSSAERSSSACTIKLNKTPIINFLNTNIKLLKWMILNGYQNKNALQYRIQDMKKWINDPLLLTADINAKYFDILEIDLSQIQEPLICVPNDPDDVHFLSEVSGNPIDDVFIGSCMTNIWHFRIAALLLNKYAKHKKLPSRLWIAPPTKMDALQLKKEGYYNIFSKFDIRLEIPGCSLCMGNQARIPDNMIVMSTSTRNFPNRLGNNTKVYLGSAEIATISAILGRIPTKKEYFQHISSISTTKSLKKIYSCLNFENLL